MSGAHYGAPPIDANAFFGAFVAAWVPWGAADSDLAVVEFHAQCAPIYAP